MGKLGWFMSKQKQQHPHRVKVSPWGPFQREGATYLKDHMPTCVIIYSIHNQISFLHDQEGKEEKKVMYAESLITLAVPLEFEKRSTHTKKE